ncbi:MAG: chorismate synthase [Bacteroidales bacterium]|nr:chorismate synthase [Bacteroidales bacterium]
MNTYGTRFRVTTYGESHGLAVGAIIDGCPSGMHIDFDAINCELVRRKGVGVETSARQEADRVEFLSGLKDGITLGTPIAFSIHNVDAHSDDYAKLEHCFRPGHADYTYYNKYGIRDHRGGGRASARETVARVVAGTIAKQLLSPIIICAEVDELGDGQTRGGIIKCRIEGVQAGIGEPVFGKLNASLAAAMMSIPSAIGFEMGAGFAAAKMSGEEYIDRWHEDGTTVTNHCGGVQGGISNGMPIEFRVAFHPVVTLPEPVDCLTEDGRLETVDVGGRHDRCHVLRTPVIVESMAALCLINYIL